MYIHGSTEGFEFGLVIVSAGRADLWTNESTPVKMGSCIAVFVEDADHFTIETSLNVYYMYMYQCI